MRTLKALMVACVLVAATAASAVQPCSTFHDTLMLLAGAPCGNPGVAQFFHISAKPARLDPRFLVAVAEARTNGGFDHCVADHDPFYFNNTCHHYPSWQDAIAIVSTSIGNNQISNGVTSLGGLCDALGFNATTKADVGGHFANLFGNASLPLYYSSSCCGDCDGDRQVEIQELIRGVILGLCSPCLSGPPCALCELTGMDCSPCPALSSCRYVDTNQDGTIYISDLIRVVGASLEPCPEV